MTHVRRNNPYATSFDGSLSTSMDRSHQALPQQVRSPATTCVRRSPPDAIVNQYVPPQTDAANFDVHSDASSDNGHTSPVKPSNPSPYQQQLQQQQQYRHSPSVYAPPAAFSPNSSNMCSPAMAFDAAQMSNVLAEAGCPIDVPCPAGAVLTVYNGDISQHFNIGSDTVQITRGSIKYADHFARYGSQTRFRFQLCHNYLQRKCAKLSECSYIHATVLPKPSEVHLNPFAPRRLAADRHGHGCEVPLSAQDDPTIADTYETLPAGFALKVFAPNDNGPLEPQLIPSEMIIVTAGAIAARRSGASDVTRPRHCAHYQFKRLCNLGSQCHFIHSKLPYSGHTAFAAPRVDASSSCHHVPAQMMMPSAPMMPLQHAAGFVRCC